MQPWQRFLMVFLLALVSTDFLIPLVGRLAVRLGAVDKPNARKIHTHPIPRLGGIAIYLGFFLAVSQVMALAHQTLAGLFYSTSFLLFIGILDDIYDLKPRVKFAGQVAAALLFVFFGTYIEFLTNPLGGMIYLGLWGIPLTILWLVSMTNIVNFLDGLDGLAAGVASIAAAAVFLVALAQGQTLVAVLMVALAGSTLGFLRHNYNPARIFMGDSGSMFLGFTLGAVAVQGSLKGAATLGLLVPAIALGVPIVDTVYAILRRLAAGIPISQADKGHFHHRLLAHGLNQRQAVSLIYLLSAALGLVAVAWTMKSLTLASLAFLLLAGAGERLAAIGFFPHLPQKPFLRG